MNTPGVTRSLFVAVLGVLFAAQSARAADDLGRLFTTPSERARLDDVRRGAPPPAISTPEIRPRQESDAVVQDPSLLTVRGVVSRSGGRSTAWVNDTNTYQGDLGAANQRVERGGISGDQVTVRLPDGRTPVKVKVGQTLDPASAVIRDLGADTDAGAMPPAGMPAEEEDEE